MKIFRRSKPAKTAEKRIFSHKSRVSTKNSKNRLTEMLFSSQTTIMRLMTSRPGSGSLRSGTQSWANNWRRIAYSPGIRSSSWRIRGNRQNLTLWNCRGNLSWLSRRSTKEGCKIGSKMRVLASLYWPQWKRSTQVKSSRSIRLMKVRRNNFTPWSENWSMSLNRSKNIRLLFSTH